MNLDLNAFLAAWPYELGKLHVRKIMGADGREKLQMRLDLGVMQMECEGRPDGLRPFNCDTILEWYRRMARAQEAKGDHFLLDDEALQGLHQEAVQFHHRYTALIGLQGWEEALRDIRHNREIFELVDRHTSREEVLWPFDSLRTHLLMVQAQAGAAQALEREEVESAMELLEQGREEILEILRERQLPEEGNPELEFLEQWWKELKGKKKPKRALTEIEQLEQEMEQAVKEEAYERAAELRDAIRAAKEMET